MSKNVIVNKILKGTMYSFFACYDDIKESSDDLSDLNSYIITKDNLYTKFILYSDYLCNYGIFLYEYTDIGWKKYKKVWNENIPVDLDEDENGIWLYDYSYLENKPLDSTNGFFVKLNLPKEFQKIKPRKLKEFEMNFLN